MSQFRYKAVNASGVAFDGTLEAADAREAARLIEGRGLIPVQIDEARRSQAARRRRKARRDDLLAALLEFSTLLQSGIPLLDAVNAIAGANHPLDLSAAFRAIATAVSQGQSFSAALASCGLSLPTYLIHLARAGELSGDLGGAVQKGVAQIEYDERLRGEIRAALIYPAILILASLAAVAVMLGFVVPRFAGLLRNVDDLPWLAAAVLSSGVFLRDNAAYIGIGVIACVFATLPLLRAGGAGRLLDGLSRVPLLREWLVQAETARWASTMAALLQARVALLDALELSASGLRLSRIRHRMRDAARAVASGSGLADALEQRDVLSPVGYNLIRAGERSGRLPDMLSSLARLQEESGRQRMKQAVALIEPLAVIGIGSVIGVVIGGIVLGLTSAGSLVQ